MVLVLNKLDPITKYRATGSYNFLVIMFTAFQDRLLFTSNDLCRNLEGFHKQYGGSIYTKYEINASFTFGVVFTRLYIPELARVMPKSYVHANRYLQSTEQAKWRQII